MGVREELENQILNITGEVFDEKAVLSGLNMTTGFDKQQIRQILKGLVRKGKIIEVSKNRYKKVAINNRRAKSKVKSVSFKNKDIVQGVLRGNPKGFAFVISEGADDLFIPHKSLKGAMHKDTVLVERISKAGEKPEGRVLRIIERGMTSLIGTYYQGRNFGFVTPDVKEFFDDIFVPTKYAGKAKNGDKVVVKIVNYVKDKNPEGMVTEILGKSGNPKTDVLSIIRSYGFYETDLRAEKEAERINELGIMPSAKNGRTDYTSLMTITIDGDDSKDFDDAISLERDEKGFKLYVHIADVSEYVKPDGIIDEEALKRATSIYFPGSVFPMIPEALSNGLCSLSEGDLRLTLTCVIELDNRGKTKAYEINKSYIKSNHRMTYANVTKILEGDKEITEKYLDVKEMLFNMQDLALILANKRNRRGAIDFGNDECKILLNDKYEVVDIKPYDYTVSNKIIEEFMILANETVAEYFARIEYPFVFRVHDKPDEEKLADLTDFVKACGFNLNIKGDVASYHFQRLLEEVKGTEYEKIISKVMLRAMQKAKYSVVNKGHFGIASDYYCHFTSPIRRYPDLMIHRVIKRFLDGGIDKKTMIRLESRCEAVAIQSSEREIAAEQAERDADDYFKAKYMEDKIGNVYEGTISGVTQFGVFVELDNSVEGMIKFEDLIGENLEYLDKKYTIKGVDKTYKLGDRIKIVVAYSDVENKKIRFTQFATKQKEEDVI